MQDSPDSMENAEPEENGRSDAADSPVVDGPTPDSGIDSTTESTVLAEVLPGIAVVFGKVPAELKPDLLDFGLVSSADRKQISTVLAAIGNTATVAGNLASALANAQGLYRISDATQALLNAGATLAVKDGANLGTVMFGGRFIAQTRLIPVKTVSTAKTAASIGPALAMIALQMQLSEVTGLVRTNVELTGQVLTSIRNEQRAELTGLVATIDRAADQAREIESVPASLWESVAGSEASLRKQLDLYRRNVGGHVGKVDRNDARRRREYLQTNAEAIFFDSFALLDSLKAWTGYKALQVGKARDAGRDDAGEARLVDVIVRDTRAEFDSALADTKCLVDSLTRELRMAELPGRDTLAQSFTGKRKDAKAARQTSARLLEAIQPLADVLHPPAPPLKAPGAVCAPESLDLKPYLRILRWFLDDEETLRVLGFPDQLDGPGSISAILGGAMEMLVASKDKAEVKTLVAVTDRRIITAKTSAFLEQAEIRQDIPIDRVRYVRAATTQDKSARLAIDLITRDENIRWIFHTDIDTTQVDALAAALAESMTIPDVERDALQRRPFASIEAGTKGESTGTTTAQPTEPAAAT
ncbi:hypothetical protein [Streptomyces clavifer]|uniref:hypothetical protein n=1 Tax=Streptomyces clavifer TaxID=68188 RepID=UPI0033CE0E61